jgi:hypothetical protein
MGSLREGRRGRLPPHEHGYPKILPDVLVPVFQHFLQVGHELIGDSTVDEAVVVAEG